MNIFLNHPDGPMTIDMRKHKYWGDCVYFLRWEDRAIAGHFLPQIRIGDFLISAMDSGKLAKFEIIEIEYARDPRDMFFGKVKDVCYVDENFQEIKTNDIPTTT
jgi:hypothetical protein